MSPTIVATGLACRTSTCTYDFAVARYNADGSLDNSFSYDGKATTNLIDKEHANGIVLQPNGKIIVAGSANMPGRGLFNFAVIRYLPNGTLDTQFGNW